MKIILIVAAFVLYTTASLQSEWSQFKLNYGKKYNNFLEDKYRMDIFLKNKKMIEEHNAKYEQGLVSFYMKMNKFGDLTIHEFRSMMGNGNMLDRPKSLRSSVLNLSKDVPVPESFDWREKGALTEVKDRGNCGASSYFTVTAVVESQNFLKTGKLVSLSEQNLMDCSWIYGNTGCYGGSFQYSYRYIQENGGIDAEEAYPYVAASSSEGTCKFNKSAIGGTVSKYIDLPENDENALKAAVATIGPIAVGIDGEEDSFPFYAGGIYYEPKCDAYLINHGMVAVGYGTENGTDYWLLRDSLGTKWGEAGYMKLARNKNNHCGVAAIPCYAVP